MISELLMILIGLFMLESKATPTPVTADDTPHFGGIQYLKVLSAQMRAPRTGYHSVT